jgi:hypothetical protein
MVNIDIVGLIPVIRPVLWPWINGTKPVAAVAEAWISINFQERQSVDTEAMVQAERSAKASLGNSVSAISAVLLPTAVIGLPVMRATALPGTLLNPSLVWLRLPSLARLLT